MVVRTVLIESMIQTVAAVRPGAADVLLHPFFWSADKRLGFFGDVSDRVEKEKDDSPVVKRLERNAKLVTNGGWRNHICDLLAEGDILLNYYKIIYLDLRKHRTYKSHSVRDLLRAMRNKKHHYRELPEDVRNALGHIPDQYLHYWTSRFPPVCHNMTRIGKIFSC